MSLQRGLSLTGDPGGDALVKDVEGQRAGIDDLIVEGADVELGAEILPGAVAEFENLKLANFVGERLAWPRDVAIDLGLNAGLVDGRVIVEVVDHLLARPVLRVNAGVDYEANGAPYVGLEPAVVGIGVLVEADIFAKTLGIESPAFSECGVAAKFAKFGDALLLLRDGDLQVMAGKALVVGDGLDLVEVAVGGVVGIDEEAAWAAAVGCARLVVGRRRSLLEVIGNGDDFKRRLGQMCRRVAAAWPASDRGSRDTRRASCRAKLALSLGLVLRLA